MTELEQLRARVEELEALLIEQPHWFLRSKLRPSERVMVGLLLRREAVTRETYEVVYYPAEAERPNTSASFVVMACNLRKKLLQEYGVELKNRWGGLYYIEPADKERLRRLAAA